MSAFATLSAGWSKWQCAGCEASALVGAVYAGFEEQARGMREIDLLLDLLRMAALDEEALRKSERRQLEEVRQQLAAHADGADREGHPPLHRRGAVRAHQAELCGRRTLTRCSGSGEPTGVKKRCFSRKRDEIRGLAIGCSPPNSIKLLVELADQTLVHRRAAPGNPP